MYPPPNTHTHTHAHTHTQTIASALTRAQSVCVISSNGLFSENFAVVGETSILVQRNQTATLPCWLRPPQSAENLEVRWYRGSENFDNTVMTHKAKSGSQSASYVGRVSFGLKDAASGGLKAGDVSLKLVNVTIQDAGVYTCFVSSSEDYGSSTVALKANMVEVSCESEGWYPQPELLWSHKNKALTSSNVKYDRDSTGLYSVHSWVLVSSSSEISCSVGVANQVTREVRINVRTFLRWMGGFWDTRGGSGGGISCSWSCVLQKEM
uniref:Ig-like domain-containing protein n=1 Tax=Nothobranchius furzeri TaxID=105023 RepID=A0A8C6P1U7_NOTFU